MTLGSLFDGIGGFPLAGVMCGITPVWSSEIEPFPLKVTAARFPDMEQLGSVTDINGAEIEPVDIITFGSPCQDLSVAGKQLGIYEGQRSNLFFEAVRIIKEMRDATGTDEHIRPRFAVWENVPGAFSSNKGADFQAVLQALASVSCDGVSIPRPKKWNHAGCVVGNGWSIAWRVYDAQYWGVPQRRKRIYLVADFASERAPEILFEREGVSGDSSESGTAGKGTAADAQGSAGGSGGVGIAAFMGGQGAKARSVGYCDDGTTPTLRAAESGSNQVPDVCYAIKGNFIDRDTRQNGCGWRDGEMHTLDTTDRHAVAFQQNQRDEVRDMGEYAGAITAQPGMHNQNYVCYPETARSLCARADSSPCIDRGQNVVALDCRNFVGNSELSATLQAKSNGGQSLNYVNPVVYDAACVARCRSMSEYAIDGTCSTLKERDHKGGAVDVVCIGNGQLHQTDLGDKAGTLNCMHDQQAVVHEGKPPRKYIVRRLTPTECARLQGVPDEWCEGLGGSDSAIYKAYGNGLALPCAYDVLHRIANFIKEDNNNG